MTTALWCILVAALLPYVATIAAKAGGRMPARVNAGPRPWLDTLEGWPRRAHWAQLNSFEVLPAFAAGVLVAQFVHAPQARIDWLAEAFIVTRIIYLICYLADLASLRSIVWFAGMGCIVALFAAGA